MALTTIVSDAVLQIEFGTNVTGKDLTLMQNIRNRVEALVRQYCRHSVTTASYTHFLPGIAPTGRQLLLPEPFVTDITSVYEDWTAGGGQGTGDFPTESLLTEGDDYFLDYDAASMSMTGYLIRRYRDWPPYPRCVKVTYTAGLSTTDLANKYYFITEAIINEVLDRYKYAKSRQGNTGAVGPVEMERLKDYTVKYGSTSTVSRIETGKSGLFTSTEMVLDPIVNMGVMF